MRRWFDDILFWFEPLPFTLCITAAGVGLSAVTVFLWPRPAVLFWDDVVQRVGVLSLILWLSQILRR